MCDAVPPVLQNEIDLRIQEHHPKLHMAIGPSVRTALLLDHGTNEHVDYSLLGNSYRKSLNELIANGCRIDEQIARAELVALERSRDGVGRKSIDL